MVLANGAAVPVNRQMRRLKAAGIALAVILPRGHRALRALYDRIGPVLARRLTHPLLADATYLALKPAEWAATLALRVLAPRSQTLIDGLYQGR